MSDFIDSPIIDCHVHLAHLDGFFMLDQMPERFGMGAINIVGTTLVGGERTPQNAGGLLFKGLHPEGYYFFGSLYYDDTETPRKPVSPAEHAEALLQAGCDGIKMLEGKPTVYKTIAEPLDSPAYDDYYAFMQSKGAPILFHVADPASFWNADTIPNFARQHKWDYTDGSYVSKEQLYREVDNLLEKFSELRIIFAHLYFLSEEMERAARFLDEHPTVSFDITPGSEMYRDFSKEPEKWKQFFTKYQDRILFGTDNSGRNPSQAAEIMTKFAGKVERMRRFLETDDEFEGFGGTVRGLKLPPEALKKIYYQNFQKYAGKKPKPVNVALAIQECNRLIEYTRNSPVRDQVLPELEEIHRRLNDL